MIPYAMLYTLAAGLPILLAALALSALLRRHGKPERAVKMRFSPALNRDQRVPVWIDVPLRFRAEDGAAQAPRTTLDVTGSASTKP